MKSIVFNYFCLVFIQFRANIFFIYIFYSFFFFVLLLETFIILSLCLSTIETQSISHGNKRNRFLFLFIKLFYISRFFSVFLFFFFVSFIFFPFLHFLHCKSQMYKILDIFLTRKQKRKELMRDAEELKQRRQQN